MTTLTSLLAFSLGGPEMAVILILILLLFGAKRLPTLARSLGKSLHEFRRAKDEFETEIQRAGEDEERKERERRLAQTTPPPAASAPAPVNRDQDQA